MNQQMGQNSQRIPNTESQPDIKNNEQMIKNIENEIKSIMNNDPLKFKQYPQSL